MVDKKYTYWMPTNGQKPVKIKDITENMLEMLQGRGLGVTVSIDGNPEIHDKTRGIKGSHKNTLESLGMLSQLKEKYTELQLTVGMTITGENMNQIQNVYRLSREYNTDFSLRPTHTSEIYFRNTGISQKISDEFHHSVQEITRDIGKASKIQLQPWLTCREQSNTCKPGKEASNAQQLAVAYT